MPVGRASGAFAGRNGVIAIAGQGLTDSSCDPVAEDLFTVWPDGESHLQPLTDNCGTDADSAPAYSANGLNIAYVHSYETPDFGCLDIALMTFAGTHRRQITNCGSANRVVQSSSPEFSPTGRTIVFERKSCRYNSANRTLTHCIQGIYTMSTTGQRLHLIRRNAHNPQFSPNGKRIVFDAYDRATQREEIYIMAANGRHVRQVTHTPDANPGSPIPAGSSLPDFSPDGKRIAFISTPSNDCATDPGPPAPPEFCENQSDLFTINVNGTGLQKTSDTGGIGSGRPCFSPDGTEIDAGGTFYPASGGPSSGRGSLPEDGCSWQPL